MSEQTNTQQGSQTGTTQPEDNGAAGRTFTQDEVNRIVSDRLARERAKQSQPGGDGEPGDDMQQRERDLAARENRLTCREYLSQQKLPEELLDLFDTADAKAFKSKCEKLAELVPDFGRKPRTGLSHNGGSYVGRGSGQIADAFKPPY